MLIQKRLASRRDCCAKLRHEIFLSRASAQLVILVYSKKILKDEYINWLKIVYEKEH